MAEDGAAPAGQDRGDPARLSGHGPVAHGAHPAMQGMQPSALLAMADRAPAEAELEQLRASHDGRAALGEPCDRDVDRRDPGFGPYDGLMFGLDGDRPMVTAGA